LGALTLSGCSPNKAETPKRSPIIEDPPAAKPETNNPETRPDSPAMVCQPTATQIAGPFPQAGFERSKLDLYGHVGVPLAIRGRVLDRGCQPIPNAKILLWHATPSRPGVRPRTMTEDRSYVSSIYDHEIEAGLATPDGRIAPTGEQMYYGWVRSDAQGNYGFETLRPGWYLNGAKYRSSHLHMRVWVADELLLTTQVYFADDDFNRKDPFFGDCVDKGGCTMKAISDHRAQYDLIVGT
jgi:protocatechuate 3,4-dioxygenase beta subunit